jgi:hypothetical protein
MRPASACSVPAAKYPARTSSLVVCLPGGVGVERFFLCLGQVPQYFVQLPHCFEGGEHVQPRVWRVTPADACEQLPGNRLAGAEAVKHGAAAEPPGPQPVVDGAGKVLTQVWAGGSGGLVDGEIRRAGEAEGRAAQREAVAAVGTKALPFLGWCDARRVF